MQLINVILCIQIKLPVVWKGGGVGGGTRVYEKSINRVNISWNKTLHSLIGKLFAILPEKEKRTQPFFDVAVPENCKAPANIVS